MWLRVVLSCLAAIALVACAATGDSLSAGSVFRSIDNDSAADSDDQYTSGLSLSYVSRHAPSFADAPLVDGVAQALDRHWPFGPEDQRFVIYSLSHRIFTPTDLSAREPVEGDLPYSALLYATATVGSQGEDTLTAASLSLGLAGPAALGEPVQSTIHRWIGAEDPQGWDEQLDHEPLLNVGLEHRRRLYDLGSAGGFGADLLGALSGSVGNLQTQATVASTARVGLRIPKNFHMQTNFLAEESLGLRAREPLAGTRSIYAYAGFAATALANAIYLDGNTFSDSHSVEHDGYVLRGSVGVAAQLGRVLVSVAYERASLPWDHPDGFETESFLRFGLSLDF
jgi:lipid A 3-O-deacylase